MTTFIWLTLFILALTLVLRATRGVRVKSAPRWFERPSIWKVAGRTVHVHHAYPGVLVVIYGCLNASSDVTLVGLALIISDLAFHSITHFVWGDPWWD